MPDTANGGNAPSETEGDTPGPARERFVGIPAAALPWLVGGLLAAAIGLVYGRSLHAPFIFDDHPTIPTNPSIRQLWPLWGGEPGSTPLSPPTSSATAGRPLVNLTLALNYAIGGLDPFGYHVFNIIVHTLASLLLWAVVRCSLRLEYFQGRFDRAAEPLAFLVALVWALHPLQTEAVQYVTQRTELMVGLFYLATVYFSLRYFTANRPAPRTTWCVLATTACWLGMACKEVMVTAPVMVLLFERTFIAGSFRKALADSWRLYVGLALSWAFLLALNYSGPRSTTAGFGHGVPLYAWWLTQAKALELYLTLSFWPWPLVVHYVMPLYSDPLMVWPSLLIVGFLGINTVLRLWWRGATGYLGAWVFIVLSPTLVVPIITEHAAERRMYLPLAAIVALIVIGGYALLQNVLQPKDDKGKGKSDSRALVITATCSLLVVAVFAVLSAQRLALYNSAIALWQDTLVHQPDNYRVLRQLARELLVQGREEEANKYYERALAVKPELLHRDWGLVLFQLDRPADGAAHFEEAIRQEPQRAPRLRSELGVMLLKADQPQQAAKQFQKAVELAPNSGDNWRHLARALLQAGRLREALRPLQKAEEFSPSPAELRQLLARVRDDVRRHHETVEQLRRELEREPNSAKLHCDLGEALYALGRMTEATAQLQEALRLQPDFPRAEAKLQQATEAQQP